MIIVLFIAAFYFFSEHKKTKSHTWFMVILIFSIVELAFDVVTVYTVNHLDTVPKLVNRVVHQVFLTFLSLLFYAVYKYLEVMIEEEVGEKIQKWKYSLVPVIITNIALCFLPLYYVETSKGNYSYGPGVLVLYASVAFYVFLIIKILAKYWKYIPAKKRKAIFIAIFGEVVLSCYQAVVPTALISCLGITLIVLGFYLTVENPDAVLVELLKEETKRADIANQAKTNFLANMSHEIRTPINAVLGMNEMILRESKEKNIREYAKDVQGAAKSLLSIINDILDITKIEAGKLAIISVEYAFSSMIHDVTNMVSFKAKAKNLEFKVNVDDKIPSRFMGDDIRIRQILVNLLNNAIKYTHEGVVTLEVRLLEIQENHALVNFLVKDTGIGIKEEDIPKLYIPFERIEEKRNRNIEGTGLGMNITMQILAMLGSRLEISSEYGKGSEFSFVLKQEVVDSRPIGSLGEQLEAVGKEMDYQTAFEAPEAKILVVDDNEMNRRVFCSLLKDTKIQIEQAARGKECIEKVKKTAFDIVFMDHMMPEMDGIETFHVMKAMEDYPSKDAPVVILTANAVAGAKEQYLKEGFRAFLSKPVDSKKLEDMIEELLPKELIHYLEPGLREEKKEIAYDISELPMIDGLDWGYASSHFKDEEAMLMTVKFFVTAIEYEAKELEELYARIEEEEGRKQYRIKVHSMKNSASTIGIIPLAGLAKVLEDAARSDEREILRELTPVFLKRWRQYKEHLKEFSPADGEQKVAAEHQEQVKEIFKDIKTAAEEMDIDALDECLEKLEEYKFEGEQLEIFEQIKKAIINFDVDFLREIM